MKKKTIIILSVVAVVIASAVFAGVTAFNKMAEENAKGIAEISIGAVDLNTVADGTYEGAYKVFPIDVVVNVTVKDHRIENIDLVKHSNGQGKPAEVIPSQVVEAQSLDVDTVSGATSSSKVILKAIELALKNGVK